MSKIISDPTRWDELVVEHCVFTGNGSVRLIGDKRWYFCYGTHVNALWTCVYVRVTEKIQKAMDELIIGDASFALNDSRHTKPDRYEMAFKSSLTMCNAGLRYTHVVGIPTDILQLLGHPDYENGEPCNTLKPRPAAKAEDSNSGRRHSLPRCSCGSFAINPGLADRPDDIDLHLCDVCFWKVRATLDGDLEFKESADSNRSLIVRSRSKQFDQFEITVSYYDTGVRNAVALDRIIMPEIRRRLRTQGADIGEAEQSTE